MKNILTGICILCAVGLSAQTPWSYVQQGTPDWPGAATKDLVVSGDDIYAYGDIGLIDIEQGARILTHLLPDGTVDWTFQYDKADVLEIAQRITVHPDYGLLTSSILVPGYRPYFACVGWDGTEIWNSASWSDALPENSASQTYAFALASGDVSCVVADDDARTVTRYLVDGATGDLMSTSVEVLDDILWAYDPADIISGTSIDFTHNGDGECFMITSFNIAGTDTTDFIFRFGEDFDYAYYFGLANMYPNLSPNSIIINQAGHFIITGTITEGAFFETYSPVVIKINALWFYDTTVEFVHPLTHATAGSITQTPDGNYKWIWYNFSGGFYDPAVGDYMTVNTMDNSFTITDEQIIQYAPYDVIECIVAAPSAPAVDDAYIMGGMSWDIGVPAYATVMSSGAADALPECIFNCVWPGDADNSGLVDMDDLLSIGLGYGTSGPTRDAVDIFWEAHQADAWATALPAGINHKYTDCNGDGMIDATDEEAVDANYSFEHPLYNLRTTEGEVPLYYSMDAPISIGENSVPIYLGDAANMVDAIYGIRFTATASGEVIEPASVYVTFEDSWFGDAGDMLQLSKSKTAAADAGLVKTDHTNSDGYGQIGTLHFVVIDNIAGKVTADEITLGFESARAIDVTGTELSLEATESVVDITLNADAQSSPQFVIYPNPVSEQVLFVTTPLQAATVTLVDITGKTVLEAQVSGQRINLPELPAGQYILRIVQDGLSHNQSICLQ